MRKIGLTGEKGFLPGDCLPATQAIDVNVGDAVLAVKGAACGGAASAPECGYDRGVLKDADANVCGDERKVFGVRAFDGIDESGFIK